MVLLFHGSRFSIEREIEPTAKVTSSGKPIPQDFGAGFYCGTQKLTALEWVVDNYSTATISVFDFDEKKIFPNFKTHKFPHTRMGMIEWALFIAYNRNWFNQPYITPNGVQVDPKQLFPRVFNYFKELKLSDIIIGPIADDKMQESFSSFMNYTMGIDALSECLLASRLGDQYVFKTQASCNILNDCKTKLLNKDFVQYLNTDPECIKRKLTIPSVQREKQIGYSNMINQVRMINRKYWNSQNQINLDQALQHLEDHLTKVKEQTQLETPKEYLL